jgi:tripartite-type tricarboxylate transporter receptor subunit TctC
MKFKSQRCMLGAVAVLLTVLGARFADAQTYPTRPIQVIVPFAGGSASDVVMRILLDRMGKSIGQSFIVDNRPGAGGNIGTAAAAKSAPDGYTLVMATLGPFASNRTLYRDLGYDPDKDFEPISLFAHFPNLIVISSKLPVNSLAELVAYAKARPKQLNYGSVGIGSSQHLSGLYFEQIAEVELTHVPYRNIAQYVPDLISGAVPLGFQWLPNVSAPLKTGDAKALAVTINKRMTALPDVPTAEAGVKNYETAGWLALMAPRGTPKPIVTRLHQEVTAALADRSVRDRFVEQGSEAIGSTPEGLAQHISSEAAKWRDIITKAGIPPIQ